MAKPRDKDRPLVNRVFFLDVKNSQLRSRLTECITRLGGIIGNFLDRKIKYVITDRPSKDWPTKEQINGYKRSHCASLVSDSCDLNYQQPIDSSVNNNVDILPRGRMLVLQATSPAPTSLAMTPTSTKNASTDVLTLAACRGLTLLVASNVLQFCEKSLNMAEAQRRTAGNNSATSGTSASKPKNKMQLKAPYLKVEDSKQLFRPFWNRSDSFSEWPEIHLDREPYLSPFGTPASHKKTSPNGISITVNRNTPDAMETNKVPRNSADTRMSNVSLTPVNTPLTFNTASYLKKLGIITPHASFTNMTREQVLRPKRKNETSTYCDICTCYFDDLDEHLNSKEHVAQVENKENYKDLIRVIKSLPPWPDIVDEKPSPEIREEQFTEEDSSGPNCPSLTPPNSSTTITLTCGTTRLLNRAPNTAKSFVALHDIAMNNNSNFLLTPATSIKSNPSDRRLNSSRKFSPTNLLNFSYDCIDEEEDVVEASCMTPPLIPPLLFEGLEIPDEKLQPDTKLQINDGSVEF
ncbi:DBF4-CDC7 kinase regulatory subunit chiffon [Brevipalpus obovatus]|uniref:DBF4-CDC7 kinase regulatory subunit chiffon n=1 Tax=Brevipalpus obovatus TaxID=246614 RepID=UPI003D9DC970